MLDLINKHIAAYSIGDTLMVEGDDSFERLFAKRNVEFGRTLTIYFTPTDGATIGELLEVTQVQPEHSVLPALAIRFGVYDIVNGKMYKRGPSQDNLGV